MDFFPCLQYNKMRADSQECTAPDCPNALIFVILPNVSRGGKGSVCLAEQMEPFPKCTARLVRSCRAAAAGFRPQLPPERLSLPFFFEPAESQNPLGSEIVRFGFGDHAETPSRFSAQPHIARTASVM